MRAARAGLVVLVAVAAFTSSARAYVVAPTAVYLEPAESRTVRQSVELPGVAEPLRRATLSAETAGRVDTVCANEGDYVPAGRCVCEMRKLPAELQLKQAQGLLDAALADLKKMEQGSRPEEIQEAEARVKAAAAAHERWHLENERTKKLLAEGASTKAELETVGAADKQAEEQMAEAQAGLKLAKLGFRTEDIDRARAQAAAQQAAVDQLKDTLAKMTVAMPFDGFIVKKYTELGEWLMPGQHVVDTVDLSVVRILLDVPERYLAGLEKGAEAPVTFEGLGDREFKGVIADIVPSSASGTHTIPVRIDVKNTITDGKPVLAAGLFARVWLPVGKEQTVILVPKAAVIRQEGRDVVYTVSDTPPENAPAAAPGEPPAKAGPQVGPKVPPIKFAVAIPVRVIRGHGRSMIVESERLKAGMPVVTRGMYLLSHGAPVQLFSKEADVKESPAAKPAAAKDPAQEPASAPSGAAR
jgi:multidrug efflux pump subunit AcrA (membrane-fusion protein)